ncbi:GDSL-type esterase/lipase family protein [Roseobacter sp. CCS2]|uniref:GDSL-type esterase/lipase family protein n=1 Tax=Roseobacter sp. CCS2 TaxID=391593 RepID=UPI0000F3E3A6|nr:GDSL-type esterase/lipase family protein [Roseobacter sp. CCS2]EBA11941.1 Lipolytic enzyme, G-D-S-L [Roseobacter sp. CCS2]
MTKTVLTFGDSNTYGTPPAHARGENRRFGPDTRWPTVMQAALGPDWALVENGLPGRTTCRADPVMGAHMDGQLGLRIALESSGPIDLLVIMLGTNDLQTHHAATVDQVVGGLAGLLAIARSEPYQLRHNGFDILLIAPPVVLEQGTYRDTLLGAHEKSRDLPFAIAQLADHWGIAFLDAGAHINSSPLDGLHFAAEDHITLGQVIAAKIAAL